MYAVFNMGHRMEVICPANQLSQVQSIVESFGIAAQQIGYVEDAHENNSVLVKSPYGEFTY